MRTDRSFCVELSNAKSTTETGTSQFKMSRGAKPSGKKLHPMDNVAIESRSLNLKKKDQGCKQMSLRINPKRQWLNEKGNQI